MESKPHPESESNEGTELSDEVLDAVIVAIVGKVEHRASADDFPRSKLYRRAALIMERARVRLEVMAEQAARVEGHRS